MERQKDIKTNRELRENYDRTVGTMWTVVIIHIVGIAGLYFLPVKPYFIHLVPFYLITMALILNFSHEYPDGKFFLFFIGLFIGGWLIEYAGVYTGQLFGGYSYGHTLGFRILKIPAIMGVNWFLLIYSTGVSMQLLRLRPMLLRVLCGAMLLVILDLLIEPVAIRLDYWHWADGEAPLQNYLCWFVVSFILLLVFEQFKFKKQSMVGPSILICQFVFFTLLQ